MIRKFCDAKQSGSAEIEAWAQEKPRGQSLYAEDAAEAIVLAAEMYESSEPVNLDSGEEVQVSALAELIHALTRFEGIIRWDTSTPDGQSGNNAGIRGILLAGKNAAARGLQRTIEWYLANCHENRSRQWLSTKI